MIITIDLSDDLSSSLADFLPQEEYSNFALNAIVEAVEARRRDEAECIAAVEAAAADMESGRGLISFEDACRQWDAEEAGAGTSQSA